MGRDDVRVVKYAFKDPKNYQNRDYKSNYETVGVYCVLANLLTICINLLH
jgi:hypothetical protein